MSDQGKEITLVNIKDKATIMSPYKLTEKEIEEVKKVFPELKKIKYENIVDENIYSGIIVKIGTKMVDLTLNSVLQSLRHQLYESY